MFIAELGTCHNKDIPQTKLLIMELKRAGVNCIKFQYWSSGEKLAKARHKPTMAEFYSTWKTPHSLIRELADYCRREGLDVMCSVFLPEDAEKVAPEVDVFKIASLESQNLAILKAVNHVGAGRPIFISTGCLRQEELSHLIKLRQGEGEFRPSSSIFLLHCITAYPASANEMNLRVITNNKLDGISDHSRDVLTGAIAYCCGARYFEFHVRGDFTPMGVPDYSVSLLPAEVSVYIKNVNKARGLLGTGVRKITKGEEPYVECINKG